MLYSMTIRLIHVHQLETPYVMGSNVNMGSFGVTGVKVIYIKQAITLPCYIAWSYMVTLTYPLASDPLSHLQDQTGKLGAVRQGDGNVSSSFFFFLSTEHISWTIEPNLMKLGHNNHWTSPHIWYDIWPRNCPLGVTGVKKVILAKIHQLLQFT